MKPNLFKIKTQEGYVKGALGILGAMALALGLFSSRPAHALIPICEEGECPSIECYDVQILDDGIGVCDCESNTMTFRYRVSASDEEGCKDISHTDLSDPGEPGYCASISGVLSGDDELSLCNEEEESGLSEDGCWACLDQDDPSLDQCLDNATGGIQTGPVTKLNKKIEGGHSVIYTLTLQGCAWTTTEGTAFIKAGKCGYELDVPIPTPGDEFECPNGQPQQPGAGGEAECVEPGVVSGAGAPGGCGKVCDNILPGTFDPQVVGMWLSFLLGPGLIAGILRRKHHRG